MLSNVKGERDEESDQTLFFSLFLLRFKTLSCYCSDAQVRYIDRLNPVCDDSSISPIWKSAFNRL